jgi:Nucleotidyltransferase domain
VAAVSDQLPETVRTTLSEFTAAAQQAFADDLVSVVLFGSAAEGRLRATSDVNLVLVLRRADPKKLEAIGEVTASRMPRSDCRRCSFSKPRSGSQRTPSR